jgi:hypothetical protein
LKLERILNVLVLHITDGKSIVFREEWVGQLRTLPCGDYGLFMRDASYPSLSVEDRNIWHNTTISNLDLQTAIQAIQ